VIVFQLVKTSLPLMEPSGSLKCPQKQTTGPYCGPKTGKPLKMEALTRSLRVSNVVNDGCEHQNLIKLQFQGLGSKVCT
jgi:hypothetical protein